MRFSTIVSVAVIATLAVAPSAFAKKGKHGKDISKEVETGLEHIEEGIKGLGQSFAAFLKDGKAHPELTAAGIAAGKKLSGALTETTEALNKQHAHIKKSEADDIALLYTYIAGNLSEVATAVRKFKPQIEKVNQTVIAEQTLPAYETEFELLGKALRKKIAKKYMSGIKASRKIIDNQLECTLKLYGLKDASPDKNTIARRGAEHANAEHTDAEHADKKHADKKHSKKHADKKQKKDICDEL